MKKLIGNIKQFVKDHKGWFRFINWVLPFSILQSFLIVMIQHWLVPGILALITMYWLVLASATFFDD